MVTLKKKTQFGALLIHVLDIKMIKAIEIEEIR